MSLFKRMRGDSGALSVGDLAVVGLTGLAVVALSGPIIFTESTHAYHQSAHQAARSVAIEVESYLQANPSVTSGRFSWDASKKQLTISGGTSPSSSTLDLPPGASLPAPGSGSAQANVITNRHQYCVVVSLGGQTAYHTQDGPSESC